MLPKKQKMTKKDFSFLKRGGKSFHSPHLTMRIYEVPNAKQSKFSFVVSKKVSKKSVVRNKLKRIGYQTIKSAQLDARKKVSCVFFLKNESENFSQDRLSKEIMSLLKTANLLS